MKTVTKDRARQFGYMLEDSKEPLFIDSIAMKAESDDVLYGMPFGCVIAPNGDIWVLTMYATHGAVAAILCPEIAAGFGAPQPTGDRDSLPVMAYQEFELECNYQLPLVRISTRFDFNVSHGRGQCWPSDLQVAALRRILKANDLLTDKIRTEVSYDIRGNDYLNVLQLGEQDDDYVARHNADAKEEMEKNPHDYLAPELVVAGYSDLV